VAKLTIKGELRNVSNLREPLDKLIPQFTKDGYYSPQPPKVESNIFTLEVFVERRAPEEYKHVLAEPKAPARAKSGTDEDDEESAAGEEEDTGKGRNKDRSKGKRRGRE
jgi:hypothetical protein